MRQFRLTALVMTAAALGTTALLAQKTTELKAGGGGTPHVRTEWVVDGANISIEFEDLGRVPMTLGKPPAASEQLTISIEDTKAGALLHVDWGTTRASAPFATM
jgi:hypothetical protein